MIDPALKAELAPTGVLRAAINMGNFLLVTDKAANGDPIGVSPDIAAEIAQRLDVPLELIPYANPGAVADAVADWDIGNIGAEPQRAEHIAFTAAYCEIQSTYLVPEGSSIRTIAEVDQPGIRIATMGRAAYGLWLENNLEHAELVKTDSINSSFDAFLEQRLDVLAGLRPRLLSDVQRIPGARILDGQFSAVQQAVGTPRRNTVGAAWLAAFVEEVKASGFVANLIATHRVDGLSVAPLNP